MSEKLKAFIQTRTGGSGRVVMTEDDLAELFKQEKVRSKTDMVVALYNKKFSAKDIAATLKHYDLMGNSAPQHVRNTIERLRGNGRIK